MGGWSGGTWAQAVSTPCSLYFLITFVVYAIYRHSYSSSAASASRAPADRTRDRSRSPGPRQPIAPEKLEQLKETYRKCKVYAAAFFVFWSNFAWRLFRIVLRQQILALTFTRSVNDKQNADCKRSLTVGCLGGTRTSLTEERFPKWSQRSGRR